MSNTKPKYKPKPAIGYLLVEGETPEERKAISDKIKEKLVRINVSLDLGALGLGEGTVNLTGFRNDFKKKDTQADYNFRIRKEKEGAEAAASKAVVDFEL